MLAELLFSGIAESHTRNASQPWSPPYNPPPIYSPNQQVISPNYFNYPSSQYNGYTQRNTNNMSPNPYVSNQRSQQQNFTDL